LELDNKTFVGPEVPLSFVTDEAISEISYVLDGQKNVTIDGNVTVTGLSVGSHHLTVYVWDTAGNLGRSETITFTIAKEEPFPTTLLIVSVVVVVAAVVGLGLLVYFKKRHRDRNP